MMTHLLYNLPTKKQENKQKRIFSHNLSFHINNIVKQFNTFAPD